MLFIELLVPKGVFGEEGRRALAARLTGLRLVGGDDVDPGVARLFDSLSHVVVREEDVWLAGGAFAGSSPRYVVNVIAGMWGREMSEHLISRITAELAEAGGDPEPDAVVNVVCVPEGGYGLRGRAQRSPDVLRLIEEAKTGPVAPAPDGMLVDPVCGATVPVAEAVMLEHDGRTYGFCCAHCRGYHAARLRDAS